MGAPKLLIAIWEHKTRRRAGRAHHVLIDNPFLISEFTDYIDSLPATPTTALFPSYREMRKVVGAILDMLLRKNHGFTLAGLRGGGATFRCLKDHDIFDLMRRGRWASQKTLSHSIQLQAAYLTKREWEKVTQDRLITLAAPWSKLLDSP